jgi:hypothetical protein
MKYMQQNIKTGNGKILPVLKDAPIYPLKKEEILSFAKEAGFTHVEFYANFEKKEYTPESQVLVAVIR